MMKPFRLVDSFRNFATAFYESRVSRVDLAAAMKPGDDTLSTKYIVLIVLACILVVLTCIIIVVFVLRWFSRRSQKSKVRLEKMPQSDGESVSLYESMPNADHMRLMRTDSSASSVSRDTSHAATPLSPLSEEEPNFERGRLEFSVCYDPESECLKAIVIQGHGLPEHHCMFFVEGTLLPDNDYKQKTSIRYHNPSPIFEEMLQFDLAFSELSEHTLCLTVFELDAFSQEMFVGKVLYSFDMEASNYKNPIKMDLELSPYLSNDKMTLAPVGEVLLSLCYLPTSGRLTLVVLKCRLFQANNGLPSPYIKVSLVLNRKQVKKIKTSVKQKTIDAVYNEAFIFDVPPQHIANVGLYARVVDYRNNQELVGRVVIGPQAKTSLGVHHWECMLLAPRKPIAQWHSILNISK